MDFEKFDVPNNHKFATVCVSQAYTQHNSSIIVADNLYIFPKSPVSIDDFWEKEHGKKFKDEVAETNLCFFAVKKSDTPKILDIENKVLESLVMDVFHALLFVCIPSCQNIHLFSGAKVNGEIQIRSVLEVGQFYRHNFHRRLEERDLDMCSKFYLSLRDIWKKPGEYLRLKRGLSAYIKALQEKDTYYRLHQLVRAIEAIIYPTGGKRDTFRKRGQLFSGMGDQQDSVFKESYDLRGRVEHMDEWDGEVEGKTLQEKAGIFGLRTKQLEELTKYIWEKVLLNEKVLLSFKEDRAISEFWKLLEEGKADPWNPKFDLLSVIWDAELAKSW